MPFPRLITPSFAKVAPLVLGVALFAGACSGDDSGDAFTAAVEAASQAGSDAAADNSASNSSATSGSGDTDGAPLSAEEADQQRYATLLERSDRFAQTPVGDGGRLAIGIECLDGFSTPTARITVVGQGLAAGMHRAVVMPAGGSNVTVNVFEEQVQDLPAGSSFYAAQTGYEAAEYVYTFESLDGATLTLGGCE